MKGHPESSAVTEQSVALALRRRPAHVGWLAFRNPARYAPFSMLSLKASP